MNEVACWLEATLSDIRRLREAGRSWPEIGEALHVCPDADGQPYLDLIEGSA